MKLWIKWVVRGVIAVVGVAVAVWIVSLLPGSLNPFKTEDVDRSQPAVLQSIEKIGQYRAATANLQLIVDLEKDTRFVPDFIKGERTLFVAAGTVDAGVDLSAMKPGAVTVDGDRKHATIVLPPARLYDARVDPARSSVVDRKRGVLDRIGSVFTDGGDQQQLNVMAQQKLQAAAAADPRVLQQARDNTKAMLTSLLTSLGFETVDITFESGGGT